MSLLGISHRDLVLLPFAAFLRALQAAEQDDDIPIADDNYEDAPGALATDGGSVDGDPEGSPPRSELTDTGKVGAVFA